ncbi:MAG: hypothetical protein ACYS9X_01005 [Planctomycetota bacterium]|jgi:hypothetical protein
MNFLKLLPAILSSLVLGAHFMRAGSGFFLLLSLLMPFLLLVRERWAARVVQFFLIAGALEWLRTTLVLVAERREAGEDWMRMVIILGSVTAFTGASAFVFRCRSLAERYGLRDKRDGQDERARQREPGETDEAVSP